MKTWYDEVQRAERLKRTRYVVECDCGLSIVTVGAPDAGRLLTLHRDHCTGDAVATPTGGTR